MASAAEWFASLFGQCTKQPRTGEDLTFDDTGAKEKKATKERKVGKKSSDVSVPLGGACDATPTIAGKAARFLIDSSAIQINVKGHPGVAFRYSKADADKVSSERAPAKWGEVVEGTDEGDGWLKVGAFYLPMVYQGVPIVTLASGAKAVEVAGKAVLVEEKQELESTQFLQTPNDVSQEKQEAESVQDLQDAKEMHLLHESVQYVQGTKDMIQEMLLHDQQEVESVQSVQDYQDAKELLEDKQLLEWMQSELFHSKHEA